MIVNWNGGPELVSAVESAVRFGGRPIVVDNASTDDTALRSVERMARATVIRRAANDGFAVGCNAGAAAGSGDVVMLLNPDAEIIAGTAADLEAALQGSPMMLLGPRLEDAAGQTLRSIRELPEGIDLVADLTRFRSLRQRLGRRVSEGIRPRNPTPNAAWIVGAALALRRTDWELLGGLDERFFLWYEDVDLGARVSERGGTIAPIDSVRVRHQGASTWVRLSRRRRQWLRARGAWRYARNHLGTAAAASIAAVTMPAVAIGVALDVAHWLARRS